MEEPIHVEPILGHLLLNIALFGDALPELAGGASPRNSTREANDDAGVLGRSVDSRCHLDQMLS